MCLSIKLFKNNNYNNINIYVYILEIQYVTCVYILIHIIQHDMCMLITSGPVRYDLEEVPLPPVPEAAETFSCQIERSGTEENLQKTDTTTSTSIPFLNIFIKTYKKKFTKGQAALKICPIASLNKQQCYLHF